jgi:hypothetical protein
LLIYVEFREWGKKFCGKNREKSFLCVCAEQIILNAVRDGRGEMVQDLFISLPLQLGH